MSVSTILLVSRLTDKTGEQEDESETLMCCFAELGGHKLLQIKIRVLLTKPDRDASISWKVRRKRGGHCGA